MKKRRLAALAIAVIVVALMLEAGILKYVNDQMTYRISEVMLDRVFTVLEKNDQSEADMIESLELTASGRIDPAVMVTHIGGLDAAAETTLNLPKIPGGKKLIYTHLTMPLTALADIVDAHNGL